MKPGNPATFIVLTLALCALCGWQWNRESKLRALNLELATDLQSSQKERLELGEKLNASTAEILRLSAALTELRATPPTVEEAPDSAAPEVDRLNKIVAEQKAQLETRQAALDAAAGSVGKANESIRKLTGERDDLVKRLNEVTAKYNALLRK